MAIIRATWPLGEGVIMEANGMMENGILMRGIME